MKWRPSILPPKIIFILLSLTAPFWLCLRSWWGSQFALTLAVATLFHPLALLACNLVLAWFGLIPIDDNSWIMPSFALVLVGITIQVVLGLLSLLRKTTGHPAQPRSNFAGSFVLLPQTRWPLPIDAIAVGALLIFYPSVTANLPQLHDLPYLGTVSWPPMTGQALYCAWMYCALSTLTFLNGGYLLGTAQGASPVMQPKPVRRTNASLAESQNVE